MQDFGKCHFRATLGGKKVAGKWQFPRSCRFRSTTTFSNHHITMTLIKNGNSQDCGMFGKARRVRNAILRNLLFIAFEAQQGGGTGLAASENSPPFAPNPTTNNKRWGGGERVKEKRGRTSADIFICCFDLVFRPLVGSFGTPLRLLSCPKI